jgi:glc operon protein GlcG
MKIHAIVAAAIVATAAAAGPHTAALAQTQASGAERSAQLPTKRVLTLEAARRIVEAAKAEATRNGWPGVIAVADDGGWPILIERMDDAASLAGVEIAPGKARTAAMFRRPSAAYENAINGNRPAAITSGFLMMEGGLPIIVDGQVIGAIGVSADTKEHDTQIAQAGLAALRQ